jgi:hypothetical protein
MSARRFHVAGDRRNHLVVMISHDQLARWRSYRHFAAMQTLPVKAGGIQSTLLIFSKTKGFFVFTAIWGKHDNFAVDQ